MKFNDVKEIDEMYGTPFYIYHSDVFESNINSFVSAFKEIYNDVLLGYSFKTNYIPAIAGSTKKLGCLAEVVSGMEYSMALTLGYEPRDIIFNGPIKKKEEVFFALDNGSVINLDSLYEVENVISFRKINPDKDVFVGLRVNININEGRNKKVLQSGLESGRFGFSEKSLEKIIPLFKENNIKVVSLHGHTSSSDRALDNYTVICSTMLGIAKKFNLKELKFFNVGGGFFGAAAKGINTKGKPTYKDYAEHIVGFLLKDEWFTEVMPFIVIEPGASVVSNAFSLYTKIYQYKSISNKSFVMVDASVFDVKPSMHNFNLPHSLITKNTANKTLINVDVVGSTCMEKDIILKGVDINQPNTGDYMRFDGVGAYTHVFTPTFINYIAPVLEKKGDEVVLLRRRQTMDDILAPFREGL